MARLIFHLLGILALLLAPLPAAALTPVWAKAAATAAAEHCEQTEADAGHQERDRSQESSKHPCCKHSTSSCCPAVAPLAGSASPNHAGGMKAIHPAWAENFLLGSSAPPPTEPPTSA